MNELAFPSQYWDTGLSGPVPRTDQGAVQPGMTLRDYFAAHAPEVPEWYPVNKDPFYLAKASNLEDDDLFTDKDDEDRTISWPYYWADEQMKIREKPNG